MKMIFNMSVSENNFNIGGIMKKDKDKVIVKSDKTDRKTDKMVNIEQKKESEFLEDLKKGKL